MEPNSPYRPRVSRETRLLLTAGVLALGVLWLLARVRFRDLPATPNPLPAVLTQLTNGARYDDLATEIARLRSQLDTSLLALDAPPEVTPGQRGPRITALRVRDDVAVALLSRESASVEPGLLGRDPASGLALVRVIGNGPAAALVPWMSRLGQPRYLFATDVSSAGVSLRPSFVASLDPLETALWPEALWSVPASCDLAPGAFVFTSDAELVGLVITVATDRAIVPAATLLAEADRLLNAPKTTAGTLGVDVQSLTESVASVTGGERGVVVTWIEPDSAAKGRLSAGDLVEAIDNRPLATREQWEVHMARLSAGETVTLRVRRRGEVRDVAVVAAGAAASVIKRSLGLTLRARSGTGAEVIRVDPASAGSRAELAVGDVITLVADLAAPTPAQVVQSYASLHDGQRLLIAVTRGSRHFVTTVDR